MDDSELVTIATGKDSDTSKEKGSNITEGNPTSKRKLSEAEDMKKEPNKPPDSWFELKVTSHVYVTGLPDDVTVEEVVEVFSKCGIIKETLEDFNRILRQKKPRVKLYFDKVTGKLKGDALVTYLKEPSVDLATKILDGTPLRLGGKILMSVTRAKFEQKGNNNCERFIAKQADNKRKKKLKKVEDKMLGWGSPQEVAVPPVEGVAGGLGFGLNEFPNERDPNDLPNEGWQPEQTNSRGEYVQAMENIDKGINDKRGEWSSPYEEIVNYDHLPKCEAAKELNVPYPSLSNRCRKLEISWPYHQRSTNFTLAKWTVRPTRKSPRE